MDQNGLEYPADHWGTDHYLNNLQHGGVGPWRTNINSSPLKPNPVYPKDSPAWRNIEANLSAIRHFRGALQDSVAKAFADLGTKYGYRMPLEIRS